MNMEWKYEMRRDMQQIIPGLWLGPYVCARNFELLRSHNITHVLCLRDGAEANIIKTPFSNITYCIM